MDFTQTQTFSNRMFTFTQINSFSKEKDGYIDEASLTMLFEKNIALETLDYLDYSLPDDEDNDFSRSSSINYISNSFISMSSNKDKL